jgi:toxin ParE1/3/4
LAPSFVSIRCTKSSTLPAWWQVVHKRRQARLDIAELARWIANDDPAAARRFLQAVEDTLALLGELPSAGAEQAMRDPALDGLRMLPVKGFNRHLVFYRPLPDGIELIRLYHAARDIDTFDTPS